MIYRRLSSTWDYTLGGGRGNYLIGAEAVAQAIKSRLLLLREEWWMDRNDGLPFWQSIHGYQGRDKDTVERLITDRILGTPNVIRIHDISSQYDPDTRRFEISVVVDTVFGPVLISTLEAPTPPPEPEPK